MKHGYWTDERISHLRSLVKSGYKDSDIFEILQIPPDVSESYLSAAIRRYSKEERAVRQKMRKTAILPPPPKLVIVLPEATCAVPEKEAPPRPLRVIPEGLKLTEQEREQASSYEPLPPLHPLTGIGQRIARLRALSCEEELT